MATNVNTEVVPTPIYRFRLAKADQESLAKMSKAYGAPNPSVFIREMVTSMCSEEEGRAEAFLNRFLLKVTAQLPLPLQDQASEEIKAAQDAVLASQRVLKSLKRRKGADEEQRPA